MVVVLPFGWDSKGCHVGDGKMGWILYFVELVVHFGGAGGRMELVSSHARSITPSTTLDSRTNVDETPPK